MPTVYKVEKCSCHLLKSHKMNPLISSVDRLKSDCSSCMHNIWWTRCLRTCCRCPLFITVATSYFKRSFLLIRYRFLSEIQCWTTKWCSAEVFILTGPENKKLLLDQHGAEFLSVVTDVCTQDKGVSHFFKTWSWAHCLSWWGGTCHWLLERGCASDLA